MSEALIVLSKVAQVLHDLRVNPILVAITLALGAAWLEQRLTREKTPQFTTDHQGEAGNASSHRPR